MYVHRIASLLNFQQKFFLAKLLTENQITSFNCVKLEWKQHFTFVSYYIISFCLMKVN